MTNYPKSYKDLYIESLTVEQIKSLMPSIWDYLLQERIDELLGKKN
jgi:hypothetical protein